MSTLDDVLQLWLSKPEFRDKFKKDPKEALNDEGITLSDDDFKKIQSYIERQQEGDSGSGANEELDKRISK